MNKVHSAVLALVMGIFLIHATDPPIEKATGSFLQFQNGKLSQVTEESSTAQSKTDDKYTDALIDLQQNKKTFANALPLGLATQHSVQQNLPPFDESSLPLYPPLQAPPEVFNFKEPETSRDQQKQETGHLPQYPPIELPFDYLRVSQHTETNADKNNKEALNRLHNYLVKIQEPTVKNTDERGEDESSYERLLDKDFIRPLLKLYEKQIHYEPQEGYASGNGTSSGRISKEDYVEDFKVLSKEELDTLMYGSGGNADAETSKRDYRNIQRLLNSGNTDDETNKDFTDGSNDVNKPARRDDSSLEDNNDKEHIGEILPPNYSSNQHRFAPTNRRNLKQIIYSSGYRMRKSYEYDDRSEMPRIPVTFPSGSSAEGNDAYHSENYRQEVYQRSPRLVIPLGEGYRTPRRFRGYAEGFQPYFDPSARYQMAWSSRRPRVIFPTDLVAFRDPLQSQSQNQNQEQEPDWLAGDNTLQDIQEQDVRDRGELNCV